jgi:hypothetical protein
MNPPRVTMKRNKTNGEEIKQDRQPDTCRLLLLVGLTRGLVLLICQTSLSIWALWILIAVPVLLRAVDLLMLGVLTWRLRRSLVPDRRKGWRHYAGLAILV